MKKGNRYFLVARDKDTNDFTILPIEERGESLETIDLYTTSFENCESMASFLFHQGKISSENIDFFIAHQNQKNGKKVLHIQEVLYASDYDIRDVARASLMGKLSNHSMVDKLLGDFCFKMHHYPKFYDMVQFGQTDLYSKFIQYFADRRFLDSSFVKYKDGCWVQKSYPLLRNIVGTFQRFYSDAVIDYDSRRILENQLLKVTDKNYDPNQISLFDYMSDLDLENALIDCDLLESKDGVYNGQCKIKCRGTE